MTEADAELIALFHDEASERLDEMDAALLAIEAGDAGAETVDALFRNAHTIKGAAGLLGFDDVQVLAHATEDVLALIRETGRFPAELAAPLLRATGVLRALVRGGTEPTDGLLDELAACQAALGGSPEGGAPAAPRASAGGGGTAAAAGMLGPRQGPPAPAGAQPAGAATPAGHGRDQAPRQRAVRVPAGKIDHLLDMVGEVVQQRRRLIHALGEEELLPEDLVDALGAGDRTLEELKDSAVGLRTLPLGAITGPLPRAVRDLARGVGKQVDFTVMGADTELDRMILEGLSEPLTHLLRNCVIHGIEEPAERKRAGKPECGRIELRAIPRGRLVEIVVEDDGRGISAEVIEQGRREGSLAELLARPGYSTAGEVTDLAGRGVGLDAVKTHVQSLGGGFEVRSEPGRGTAVVLLLPLALALLDVLLFRRGAAVFGVPLPAVEEVVLAAPVLMLQGRPSFGIRGEPLPVRDVAELVGVPAPALGGRPPGLVLVASGRRAIVTCDELLGEQEVVVKPLGPMLASTEGYLGAAILGDGRIALLLEPAGLVGGFHRPAVSPGPSRPAAGQRAVPKVLVVEDSFSVRELQRSILEAAGYRVVTARDGREALGVLGRDGEISLVLTDFEMPGLTGIELTRAIRADPAHFSLPVVIVTSRGSEGDRRQGIEAGADAYMTKQGFDQHALLATVERLAGRAPGHGA